MSVTSIFMEDPLMKIPIWSISSRFNHPLVVGVLVALVVVMVALMLALERLLLCWCLW